MTIWARRGRDALLRMRRSDWETMIIELRRRGHGRRESGAFLLADRDGAPTTVTRVVYLDDLDPNCLTGGISFDGLAYSKLWDGATVALDDVCPWSFLDRGRWTRSSWGWSARRVLLEDMRDPHEGVVDVGAGDVEMCDRA